MMQFWFCKAKIGRIESRLDNIGHNVNHARGLFRNVSRGSYSSSLSIPILTTCRSCQGKGYLICHYFWTKIFAKVSRTALLQSSWSYDLRVMGSRPAPAAGRNKNSGWMSPQSNGPPSRGQKKPDRCSIALVRWIQVTLTAFFCKPWISQKLYF